MRWLKKKPRPEGTVKRVVRFAWFPVTVDVWRVWLERYSETYTWSYEQHEYGSCYVWKLKWRHLGTPALPKDMKTLD